MAVSATICAYDERDKLGFGMIPEESIDIPISFQRVFNDYWKPVIERLELPTLRWVGALDVDYAMWPAFKGELLTMQKFLRENPEIALSICKEDCGGKLETINEDIIPRIDYVIEKMQRAFDLSDKIIYSL